MHHVHDLAAPDAAAGAHPAGLAPLGAAGAPPGGLTGATNDEAPGVQAGGFKVQGTADGADSSTSKPAQQLSEARAQADRKRFETLRARLALVGWSLEPQTDGAGFLAARWSGVRDLADLPAVEAFCGQVGAPG